MIVCLVATSSGNVHAFLFRFKTGKLVMQFSAFCVFTGLELSSHETTTCLKQRVYWLGTALPWNTDPWDLKDVSGYGIGLSLPCNIPTRKRVIWELVTETCLPLTIYRNNRDDEIR